MLMLCYFSQHVTHHTHTCAALGWAVWNPIRTPNVSKEPVFRQPHAHHPMLLRLRVTWYFCHTREQSWPRFRSLLILRDSAPWGASAVPRPHTLLQVSISLCTCNDTRPEPLLRALGGRWAQLAGTRGIRWMNKWSRDQGPRGALETTGL